MGLQHSQDCAGQQLRLNNGQPSLPYLSRYEFSGFESQQRIRLPSVKERVNSNMAPAAKPITHQPSFGIASSTTFPCVTSVSATPTTVANKLTTQSLTATTTNKRVNKRLTNDNSCTTIANKDTLAAGQNPRASKTSRKRSLDVLALSDDEDESIVEDRVTKRVRTVAVPKRMGAKVSRLVSGYEQSNGVGRQQPTAASKKNQAIFIESASTSAKAHSSTPRFPSFLSLPFAKGPASPPDFDHFSGASPRVDQLTIPPRAPKTRYFECSRCTVMTPYDFDAHSANRLSCGGCGHRCCMDCLVDSVGEECQEAEWHRYEGGYMEWRVKRTPPKVVWKAKTVRCDL